MLERFTRAARDTVVASQLQARTLNHPLITTAHLLLALTDGEQRALLASHGVTTGTVSQTLTGLVRQGPRSATGKAAEQAAGDAAALAALGIDLERIRAATEARFGPGALERDLTPAGAGQDGRPGLLGRLRSRLRPAGAGPGGGHDEVGTLRSLPGRAGGHLPFSRASKKSLELALREAIHRGDRQLGTEHLLLGLLRCGDGAAAAVLRQLGTDVAGLRAALVTPGRRSA